MQEFLKFEEALAQMLASIKPMPTTRIRLSRLSGSVTASPVVASMDSPSFDNSAVDGFGVRASDLAAATKEAPVRLAIKRTLRAGDEPGSELLPGCAFKILTGAGVPPGVDTVIMKEYCLEEGENLIVSQPVPTGEHIRRRGEEFLQGQEVLSAGKIATPPVVGLIAGLGYNSFPVYSKPKVAVVTTGSELTRPGRALESGKIYDSNSYAMLAALEGMRLDDCRHFHASEDKTSTKKAMARALSFADLIISAGGVSVGDYDFVKEALSELGVETRLWGISIKPGRPVYYGVLPGKGKRRDKYVFGLPGNPVSVLVTYHQLVKPCLLKLMGVAPNRATALKARLASPLHKRAPRLEFVRAVLQSQDGQAVVLPTSGQYSHMLSGLAAANAFILFPSESKTLNQDEAVDVEYIDWSL